ncbi:MAG TPA: STAS domain-containing protein [Segeticoccus sp.]|uniref:STAS domain-containing protein n=1 Tax=Segeticoccus sp. TaxID=2706531 RepID=UPI002D7F5072|nr:STAS domain-containing protein [Segeticoccus sp.]HET8602252.1 STAS domain-containing protein [Segeticoccus sp.]
MPSGGAQFRFTTVLSVSGPLDLSNVQELRAALDTLLASRSDEVTDVVLDLSGVPLLSAAAMAAVLSARDAYAGYVRLHVVAAGEPAKVLEAATVSDDLPVVPTVDLALAPHATAMGEGAGATGAGPVRISRVRAAAADS